MTLIVLALDAVDAGLVEEWEIESLMLEQNREIETFDYSKPWPYTLEVWPSIATGKHPREHGVDGENSSNWSTSLNPLFNLGSKILPDKLRMRIGAILEDAGLEYSIREVDCETFMDGENRVVHNWPCVANSEVLDEMWDIFKEDSYTVEELNRIVFGKSAGQFGWAREMLNYNLELAAVHIHALDIMGHTYTTSEEHTLDDLRASYEKAGKFIDEIRDEMNKDDDILILSDHGMTNSLFDEEPGIHSYRAFASTTIDEPLPKSVFDYKDWIEENCSEIKDENQENVSMPKEQLKELGYID